MSRFSAPDEAFGVWLEGKASTLCSSTKNFLLKAPL